MHNVSHITDTKRFVIDLREHQERLIAAEEASWNALGAMGTATTAYVQFVRDMKLSSLDPKIGKILKELPSHIEAAAKSVAFIEECHRTANKILGEMDTDTFKLDAAYPKDRLPNAPGNNG